MPRRFDHVYGPVTSRRYGLSLGVDVIPAKTCSYDCVYCQVGRTTDLTVVREDFAPPSGILDQVREALDSGPAPDVVTLAGSGEPTLCLSLGEVIEGLRSMAGVPVILITNGAMMSDPEVRRASALADVVVPSLDAGDRATFERINRPHPSIDFDEMVEGLLALRGEARGRFDLEVLLARGLNDSPAQVAAIAAIAARIGPDVVQINTAVRPPVGGGRYTVPEEEMGRMAAAFGPRAEVIAGFHPRRKHAAGSAAAARIEAVLARRPSTAQELASSLGIALTEVVEEIARLEEAGSIEPAGPAGHFRMRKPVERG